MVNNGLSTYILTQSKLCFCNLFTITTNAETTENCLCNINGNLFALLSPLSRLLYEKNTTFPVMILPALKCLCNFTIFL